MSYNNRFKSRSLMFDDPLLQCDISTCHIERNRASSTLKKLRIINSLTVDKNSTTTIPNVSFGTSVITTNNISVKDIMNNRVLQIKNNVILPIDTVCNGYEIQFYNLGTSTVTIMPNNVSLNPNCSIKLIYVDNLKKWIN